MTHGARPPAGESADASLGQQAYSQFPVIDLSAEPTMEPVVEVHTVVGPLLLPRDDRVMTPALAGWRVWEDMETRYVRDTLQPGHTFVDVGAHVGYYSVLASKLVGSSGTVIAVEPEARNLDLLHRNLTRNGCRVAHVIPFAAGATAGWMSLELDEHNRGGHRLVGPGDAAGNTSVRCVRLDEVLPGDVHMIKIDVQGYDHEVIAGLERTIAANPGLSVIVEFSRDELTHRNLDLEAVLASYETRGFVLRVFDRRTGELPRLSIAEIVARSANPSNSAQVTLLLRRPATAPFSLTSCPSASDDLKVSRTGDALTILEPVQGRVHRLNQTAAVVFELCTGGRSVASIAELVQEMYGLPEPPTNQVQECLDRLRREGIVT